MIKYVFQIFFLTLMVACTEVSPQQKTLTPAFKAGASAFNAQEYKKALEILLPLAEQGDSAAQVQIGAMYEEGKGVPQDYSKALHWYKSAAAQGDALGEHNLANFYRRGIEVPQNFTEAKRLYQSAALKGYDKAQFNLGVMYANGDGVRLDRETAYMWLTLAKENGHSRAAMERDLVSKNMSTEVVNGSKQKARRCLDSNYTSCG